MPDFKLTVPTYNAALFGAEVEKNLRPEFGEPNVPVLIREDNGVRVVLGTHDFADMDKADLRIERQPNGWIIFLHPGGGGDPSGVVYFRDDGHSFVVPEFGGGGTDPIELLEPGMRVPGFDE